MQITRTTSTHGDPRVGTLHAALRNMQTRLRLREAVGLFPMALSFALGAALVLGVVSRLDAKVSLAVVGLASVGMVAAALLTVFAYAMLRQRDLLHTARRADLLLSLDERLSTAFEDTASTPADLAPSREILRDAQLDDALAAASRVDLRRDLPLRVERRSITASALLLVAVIAALFTPIPGIGPSAAEKAVTAQVGAERKEIEELDKAIKAQPPDANDPARQALNKELEGLLSDLNRDGLTREEALARLSQSEEKLEKTLDPQAPAQREALDQLARQLSSSDNPDLKSAGDALKAGDYKTASSDLKKAGEDTQAMTPEERKQAADSLRAAQESAAALDPELARRLNDAANAVSSGDPKAAQDALKNLGQNIEQSGQQLATQQQVEQALSQIQQSKGNIAQAGQPTPSSAAISTAQAQVQGTAVAGNGTPFSGTPASGTPLSGTALAQLQTSVAAAGSPAANGTPLALGSPVKGQITGTGTPVIAQGAAGTGTPVAAQGQAQGSGQGQSQGQGSGQGAQSGQGGQQGSQGQGSAASGWGTGYSDPVYAPPSSVNAPSTVVPVQGQNNPGGEQSSTSTNTDANNVGASQVPYDQVYGQYKDQAGRALNNDYIPQGYKDLVKDYFSSIEPGK